MNGMFNTFETARQAVGGALAPAAEGLMAGQKMQMKMQADAARAAEDRRRWEAEMKLSTDKFSQQKARDAAQASYLKAQETKWKNELAGGKLPAAVRTQEYIATVENDPNATPTQKAAAAELRLITQKADRSLPTKNFMSFVDKRLGAKKFGNQKLKEDMDPAQYGDFVSEVALLAHQMKKENGGKMSMQQAIDKAYIMTSPMLKEQSWWQPGADLEFNREGGAPAVDPKAAALLDWAKTQPHFQGKSDEEIIQMAKQAGKL